MWEPLLCILHNRKRALPSDVIPSVHLCSLVRDGSESMLNVVSQELGYLEGLQVFGCHLATETSPQVSMFATRLMAKRKELYLTVLLLLLLRCFPRWMPLSTALYVAPQGPVHTSERGANRGPSVPDLAGGPWLASTKGPARG